MPLAEHLKELRFRLILGLIGLSVGTVIGWFVYPHVFFAIMAPLREISDEGRIAALNFGTIGSAFDTQLRISVFLGVFISCPWWIYQLWRFVTPGLTRKERRYTLGFSFTGALLFIGGGAIGWLILPRAVHILTSFTPESAMNLMDARMYFTFFTRIVGAFGIAFLTPLIMFGLNLMGVVRGKSMLKQWRWAVVLAFTFTAIANPLPDAWSMIIMAIPIIALYFVAVFLALRHDKRADAKAAKEMAELDAALAEPELPQAIPPVEAPPAQALPAHQQYAPSQSPPVGPPPHAVAQQPVVPEANSQQPPQTESAD